MIFALAGHLWLTNIPKETGITRATREIPVKKEERSYEPVGCGSSGQDRHHASPSGDISGVHIPEHRAHTHTLPTPAHLLFYRLCYLRQPVEVIAILPSYMLIHLHQKGRQKSECANHLYPVMWAAVLNVHFACRCFATVPYQQRV